MYNLCTESSRTRSILHLRFGASRTSSPAMWTEVISNDQLPSSLKFIDVDVVIGRDHNTTFQPLPDMSSAVSSTIRLCAPSKPASFMTSTFGHVEYDPHSQMLWVATN
jgi:hypothetical protein